MKKIKINGNCPNCGSQLKYDPSKNKIKCISCSSTFEVESLGKGNLDNEERDYYETLSKLRENKITKQIVTSLNCRNCGAMLRCDNNTLSGICPFCGSSHIVETNLEEEIIPINGIVPFSIDIEECNLKFHNWIKRKFFAPNKFKKTTFQLDLYQVYLPFWTFDMECVTEYEARRGDYIDVPVEDVDINGNKILRYEKEIRWSRRNGICNNSFDDVLVFGSASNQTNRYNINKVCNFNFNNMEKFNPEFLIGYPGEKISLPLEEGFKQAKQNVKPKIEETIEWDVGGDEVRIISTHTTYSDITFKQVLVPIYNGIYSYNGRQYNFAMNGQTGKFSGGYPISGVKVFFLAIFIIAIILSVVAFIVSAS